MGIAAPVIYRSVRTATNGQASGQNPQRDILWQIFQLKNKHEISAMAEHSVCHSVHNVVAGLQEIVYIVYCNQVHVHRIETVPQGQGYLAIMYCNGLHLGMQFIKPSRVTFAAAIFHIAFPYKISYWRYTLNHWEPPAVCCLFVFVFLFLPQVWSYCL